MDPSRNLSTSKVTSSRLSPSKEEKPRVPPHQDGARVSPSKDKPPVVRPPRLKTPSRTRESGKSSLPISTKYSPPRDISRSSSVGSSRVSRPRSSIPTRGEVVRNSLFVTEDTAAPASPRIPSVDPPKVLPNEPYYASPRSSRTDSPLTVPLSPHIPPHSIPPTVPTDIPPTSPSPVPPSTVIPPKLASNITLKSPSIITPKNPKPRAPPKPVSLTVTALTSSDVHITNPGSEGRVDTRDSILPSTLPSTLPPSSSQCLPNLPLGNCGVSPHSAPPTPPSDKFLTYTRRSAPPIPPPTSSPPTDIFLIFPPSVPPTLPLTLPTQTPLDTDTEEVDTAKLRRNANEYLKWNHVRSRDNSVTGDHSVTNRNPRDRSVTDRRPINQCSSDKKPLDNSTVNSTSGDCSGTDVNINKYTESDGRPTESSVSRTISDDCSADKRITRDSTVSNRKREHVPLSDARSGDNPVTSRRPGDQPASDTCKVAEDFSDTNRKFGDQSATKRRHDDHKVGNRSSRDKSSIEKILEDSSVTNRKYEDSCITNRKPENQSVTQRKSSDHSASIRKPRDHIEKDRKLKDNSPTYRRSQNHSAEENRLGYPLLKSVPVCDAENNLDSIDSQPRTFIVSKEELLPTEQSVNPDEDKSEIDTMNGSQTTEESKQKGSNDHSGSENNGDKATNQCGGHPVKNRSATMSDGDCSKFTVSQAHTLISSQTSAVKDEGISASVNETNVCVQSSGDILSECSHHHKMQQFEESWECKIPPLELCDRKNSELELRISPSPCEDDRGPEDVSRLSHSGSQLPSAPITPKQCHTVISKKSPPVTQLENVSTNQPQAHPSSRSQSQPRPLEPIYESVATPSESQRSGPGVLGGQTQHLRGQHSQSEARLGQRRSYWPEEDLCSPLTRRERQTASKGLSLPDSRASGSLCDKSFSLGNYYTTEEESQVKGINLIKSSSKRLIKRLIGLRQSLRHKPESASELPPLSQLEPNDSDRVFFRGFSGATKEQSPDSVHSALSGQNSAHLLTGLYSPTAPPRKRRLKATRAKWESSSIVGRSFSFNDAERIAEAVEKGDSAQVEALYPDFPRSSPIYAVIDKSKKRKRDKSEECKEESQEQTEKYQQRGEQCENKEEESLEKKADCERKGEECEKNREECPGEKEECEKKEEDHEKGEECVETAAENTYLCCDSDCRTDCESECHSDTEHTLLTSSSGSGDRMVKSHSASNSPVTNNEFDINNLSQSKLRKRKQKKQRIFQTDNFSGNTESSCSLSNSIGQTTPVDPTGWGPATGVHCVHSVHSTHHREPVHRHSHNTAEEPGGGGGGSLGRRQGPDAELQRSQRCVHGSGDIETGKTGDGRPPGLGAAHRTQSVIGDERKESRQGVDKETDEVEIVLALADEHLDQAGSLLSSLRREQRGAGERGEQGNNPGLVRDIETNIGVLEETRERIGDAIEIYRAVQERQGEVGQIPPPLTQHRDSGGGQTVTFQATVNVQHKVTKEPIEAVITRTVSRRRRSGEENKRVGQVWEDKHGTQTGVEDPKQTGSGAEEGAGEGAVTETRTSFGGSLSCEGDQFAVKRKTVSCLPRPRWSRQESPDSSSSSPTTERKPSSERRVSTRWYDGDEDSSDSRQRKVTDSEKSKNKILELSRSFKKNKKSSGKKKRSSEEFPNARETGDVNGIDIGDTVADVLTPMRIEMGNEISSADEARPGLFTPCATNPNPLRVIDSPSTCESYRTLNSHRNSSASPVKRRDRESNGSKRSVSRLVARFEQYDVTDGRGSVISSQSGSTESFDPSEDVKSSTSSMGRGEPLTPSQRNQRKTYMVAKEIMSSEKVYVDVLRMISVEFREYVERKSTEMEREIICPDIFAKLFSNIPQLMMFNEELLKDFEDRIENWDSLKKIADVLVRKGPFLRLYATYLSDFETTTNLFEECCSKFPYFGEVVRDFESLPRCGNLKLKMHMLKPVQRLPQYKLLLEDYLKHQGEESVDFDDTTEALRIVSEAAGAANNSMKIGDHFQKMLNLQSRVGDFELIQPGRELLKEGELMKISRSEIVPRYFILLTDCLLYTHYQGPWAGDTTRLRVTYCLKLDQLSLSVPSNEEFQEEFSITSNIRSVTVRATCVRERNDWLEAINSAIEELHNRQSSFSPMEELGNSARKQSGVEKNLGEVAPIWIPDQRCAFCQVCSLEFRLTVRRHHCRCCGSVICSRCSANKAPIKYLQYQRVRVCDLCYNGLRKKYQHEPDLLSRFKKKDSYSPISAYIPPRLREAADSHEVQMSGFLKWRRGKGAGWKRNWFVLKDLVLFTFKAVNDKVATDTMPVLGWTLETLSDKNFELYEGEPAGLVFLLTHPGQESLAYCAENDNLAEKWMTALREATCLD